MTAKFDFKGMVSWCSWLSRHAHTVKVAGSNPAETTHFALADEGLCCMAHTQPGTLSKSHAMPMAQLCVLLVLRRQQPHR